MLDHLEVRRTNEPKPLPAPPIAFGSIFSDHVFRMTWTADKGEWHSPRIEPYGSLHLPEGAAVLHYSQTIFEGMKAYQAVDGRLVLFRPSANGVRFARSAERMCMPPLPVDAFVEGIRRLVAEDERWVRFNPSGSLYIRPLMVAAEPFLGVRPANRYEYVVMTCPVGDYDKGFNPSRIWVEREMPRAAAGGVGEAKTGGNYAASLAGQARAKAKGYDQVLWTDAKDHELIEEIGTMNVFFKFKSGEVATPALSGTILPGITRDSALRLLRDAGMNVTERPITVTEVREAATRGELLECFGTGTAVVVAPVGHLGFEDGDFTIGDGAPGPTAQRLNVVLNDIQRGRMEDIREWVVPVL